MLTKLLFLCTLAAGGIVSYAQSSTLPDCRDANLKVGEKCVFRHTQLPEQTYLGDIALPSSAHVRVFDPLGISVIAPALRNGHQFDVVAMGTIQSESVDYSQLVSDGYKISGTRQWSSWRGIDIRATMLRYDAIGIGTYAGNNHTEAIAAGPRVQHYFGRRGTIYGEALVGALYQYAPGMSTSGVIGSNVWLGKRVSFVPFDAEYRYASLQTSTAFANPIRGRLELSSGLMLHVGGYREQ